MSYDNRIACMTSCRITGRYLATYLVSRAGTLASAQPQPLLRRPGVASLVPAPPNPARASAALRLLLRPTQVLIFSQFTRMLDILEDYLAAAQYPCERIDGSVSLRERQAAIDRYSKGAPGCVCDAALACHQHDVY